MSDQKQSKEAKAEIKEQPVDHGDQKQDKQNAAEKIEKLQVSGENSKTNAESNDDKKQNDESKDAAPEIPLMEETHKLHTAWEFWYYKRPNREVEKALKIEKKLEREQGAPKKQQDDGVQELSYREQLKPLGKISTVEDFFSYYVYQKSAQDMPREIDLFFFRHGEVPMWEQSPQGGIWITKVRKDDDVDRMWEALLLALIGEQFGEPNVIGVSLSLRTKERLIQVWLKDAQNQKMKAMVSNRMRHFLQLDPDSTTLYFKDHQNSIKDKSTMKNALGYKFEKKNKPQGDAKSQMSNRQARGDQSNKGAPWSGIAANDKYSDSKRQDRIYSGQNDRKHSGQVSNKSFNRDENTQFRKGRKSYNEEDGMFRK